MKNFFYKSFINLNFLFFILSYFRMNFSPVYKYKNINILGYFRAISDDISISYLLLIHFYLSTYKNRVNLIHSVRSIIQFLYKLVITQKFIFMILDFNKIYQNKRYRYASVSSKEQSENSSMELRKAELIRLGVFRKKYLS